MDHASAVYAAMSGEACRTSASANTMYTTPFNIDLGARAALEAAGQMEGQISGQGGTGSRARRRVGVHGSTPQGRAKK